MYTLIIMVCAGGCGVDHVEFPTQRSCENARALVMQTNMKATAVCVPRHA